MTIISKDNKICKLIKSLQLKKYRDANSQYIIEGKRAVKDVLSFDSGLIDQIVVREDNAGFNENEVVIKNEIFDSIVETQNSQGILAIAHKNSAKSICSNFVLLLDGIKDPGNLGTLIRTALAAGYNDVILKNCCDEYSGKVVRSTMSAIVKVNILHYSNLVLEKLKEMKYNIVCADMNGENVFLTDFLDKICLVIGSEAEGVSEEIRFICNKTVSIPMDKNIESLNAAVSGGILMYNLKNRRI